ncbi:MAG: MBL fold metallo-hydrolase [Clostridiales bacterium]|jgi:L-ascorbate metabolism protein UlaG (beta-lactamase superfamily)|nr:MBL fold metallo-hydrolase [Clostridiales bacterium]
MLISYHGHSEFLVELADGRRVLFDPFPPQVNFPQRRVRADVVSVSHQHFDHNFVDKVDGKPVVVDTAGSHQPLPGIRLQAVTAFHDDQQGRLRGETLCVTLEADWLKVCHLGDLGVAPDKDLREKLFMPDILLIPIGGTYTLDAQAAKDTIEALQPRVIIPMHYKSDQGGIDKITTLAPFLELMRPLAPSTQPLLRVTREDLSQQPRLVELTVR